MRRLAYFLGRSGDSIPIPPKLFLASQPPHSPQHVAESLRSTTLSEIAGGAGHSGTTCVGSMILDHSERSCVDSQSLTVFHLCSTNSRSSTGSRLHSRPYYWQVPLRQPCWHTQHLALEALSPEAAMPTLRRQRPPPTRQGQNMRRSVRRSARR